MIAALIAAAALVVHLGLMLALAPLLVGCLRWLEARLTGHVGPPPLQPWRDLLRLALKQPVLAGNASWLFRAAPVVAFAATLAAAALVPSFALGMLDAPFADLVAIVGLLALARCTLALAGLDTGTAFGGLGASRVMTVAALAEPTMLLVVFALGLLAGSTNLDSILAALSDGAGLRASLGLALVALVMAGIAECGRLPLASPATRLELAMAHEALGLEYSGWYLALLQGTAALKLLLWLTLIGTILAPFGLANPQAGPSAWLLALPAWGVKVGVLAAGLAMFESAVAGMRLARAAEFLGVAAALGLLAAVVAFAGQVLT
jgi:formate hydrogenlyase subunit 4